MRKLSALAKPPELSSGTAFSAMLRMVTRLRACDHWRFMGGGGEELDDEHNGSACVPMQSGKLGSGRRAVTWTTA